MRLNLFKAPLFATKSALETELLSFIFNLFSSRSDKNVTTLAASSIVREGFIFMWPSWLVFAFQERESQSHNFRFLSCPFPHQDLTRYSFTYRTPGVHATASRGQIALKKEEEEEEERRTHEYFKKDASPRYKYAKEKEEEKKLTCDTIHVSLTTHTPYSSSCYISSRPFSIVAFFCRCFIFFYDQFRLLSVMAFLCRLNLNVGLLSLSDKS